MNGKLRVTTLSPEEIRYTGKPYSKALGAYVFNARRLRRDDQPMDRLQIRAGFRMGRMGTSTLPCRHLNSTKAART